MKSVMRCLDEGGTVLTVNRRLARFLVASCDQYKVEQGLTVWTTPEVLPYGGWLERCWDELTTLPPVQGRMDVGLSTERTSDLDGELSKPPVGIADWPMLLSPAQEQALWEQIIGAENSSGLFLDLASVVGKVMQAYELWHTWSSDAEPRIDSAGYGVDSDDQAFQTWMALFEDRCTEEGWISSAKVPGWLARFSHLISVGSQLLLAGFDRLSPAQERLWHSLARQGVTVSHWQPPGQQSRTSRLVFPDQESEIVAAAHWARRWLENDRQGWIGVVVPDLHRIRDQVARIFTTVLHPETLAMTTLPERPLFNISLGWPLIGYPLIQDMFLLLEGMSGAWSLTDVGVLLRSPCIAGGESERLPRALLDRRLRDRGSLRITLERWQQSAGKQSGQGHCPLLQQLLTRAMALLPPPGMQTPGEWIETFARWLSAWGWPGERSLSSREFQTWEAGRELLATFATLERVVGNISLPDALRRLRSLARQRLYQPETPDAPVQIEGVLEATGEPFSALWLLGFSGEVWPAAPDPNPFLPMAWQRQRGVPRASAQGELAFAEGLTRRLLASAPEVVVSHAQLLEGLPHQVSPLIADVPEIETDSPEWSFLRPGCQSTPCTEVWEHYVDHQGPPLARGTLVSGGARILKSQAECPFQAFALHRLGATPLSEVEAMVDARTRGTLVHHVMEQFWRVTPSLERLIDLDATTLTERIRRSVVAVVRSEAEKKPDWFPPGLRRLEEKRLIRLLSFWLELERSRTRPFQVISQEGSRQLAVGGLVLELRPDRVDQLDDGRHVVIDYKTGDPSLSHWRVPRLREPQLPLYCLIQGESVAALVFAKVRSDKPEWIGLGEEDGLLPLHNSMEKTLRSLGVADWSGLLSLWRDDLTGLAEEFLAGRAVVSPLAGACDRCRLAPLCRIHASETFSEPADQTSDHEGE
ncbi:MAG: PD-(D/E)XK nuclease family protein [Magnetococcales bacterium]|nr:PD-(D/E)XK nuclease family protein [Magnetococcales bacterium]